MKRIIIESLVVAGLIVGLVAALITGLAARVGDRALYASGLLVPNAGSTTIAAGSLDTPTDDQSQTFAPPTDSPVAAPATSGPTPKAQTVTQRINALDRKKIEGKIYGLAKTVGGPALWQENAKTVAIPASTTKLVTSLAVLDAYGREHRFATTVVSEPGGVVLVGGGDPLLGDGGGPASYPAWTSMQKLATDTAAALRASGRRTVTLGYDASLFAGPSWNPDWPSGYADQVTPVSALMVNGGRTGEKGHGPRVREPAKAAADRFAQLLTAAGITVSTVVPQKATGTKIAAVESAPVGEIVEHLLLASDNDVAEAMLRQVAIAAGKPGTFTDGVVAVTGTLTKKGLWVDGTVLRDGSGLSRSTRLSASTLVGVLELAAVGDGKYRPIVTGLPVGGVSGTLATRYVTEGTEAGRGEVRAKTGTLLFTHTLAGYVRGDDGSLSAFAFLVNDAKGEYEARVWLELASAVLAACGCR